MKQGCIHFDRIASNYDEQLPKHIRDFLLLKKTNLTVEALRKYNITEGRGIDLGCGTGWYLKALSSEYNYRMTGIDSSISLIEEAKRNNSANPVELRCLDMLKLDFPAETFDFAYCINSLHHLQNDNQLQLALKEIYKILKKGGLCIIHELNTFFLFRLYLNYIFPLTNKIDKIGGENWVSVNKLFQQDLFQVKEVHYYTFFPHIIPKFLFCDFLKLNRLMEKIYFRKFGVHYMAVLKK